MGKKPGWEGMSSAFAKVLQRWLRKIAGAAGRGKVVELKFSSFRM
jgi:hypothetical protein